MKLGIRRFIVLLQTLALTFPLGIFNSVVYAASPTPTPTRGNCDVCDLYVSEASGATSEVLRICGIEPTGAIPDGPIKTSSGITFPSYGSCRDQISAGWSALGQKCGARQLYKNGKDGDFSTAIAFTAAAGVCAAACAASFTGFLAPAANTACTVADAGATVYDLATTYKLMMDGAPLQQFMEISSFGLAAASVGVAYYGRKATNDAAKAAARQAAADKAQQEAGEQLAQSSGKGKASKASCVAAGMLAVVATLKWVNYDLNKKGEQRECNHVSEMESYGSRVASYASDPHKPGNQNRSSLDSNGAAGAGNNAHSGVADPSLDPIAAGNDGEFPSGKMSAALQGPLGQVFESLPNKAMIPNALGELGTSLGALGRQLQTKPPGAAISAAMPGLPENISEGLKEIDRLVLDGKVSMAGLPSAVMTSGGGGGGAGRTEPSNPFAFFGSRGAGLSASGPKEMGFQKKSLLPEPGNGDIWHSDWNGSIFQIVSSKINKTRERIDQLEWTTPLNRALLGLPKETGTQKRGISGSSGGGLKK